MSKFTHTVGLQIERISVSLGYKVHNDSFILPRICVSRIAKATCEQYSELFSKQLTAQTEAFSSQVSPTITVPWCFKKLRFIFLLKDKKMCIPTHKEKETELYVK